MVVQVATFWHVVQDPIQILGVTVGFYVIKPVSIGNLRDKKYKEESTDVYHLAYLIRQFLYVGEPDPHCLYLLFLELWIRV